VAGGEGEAIRDGAGWIGTHADGNATQSPHEHAQAEAAKLKQNEANNNNYRSLLSFPPPVAQNIDAG
jgi:hypothetical protein